VQLWYSGGNAISLESREFGRAPSQWLSPIFATRSVYGCEMDESDIRAVINLYVEAGKRAEQAGFDLLEVSAGDDTLPMQFLEPRFNRRTDHYGGSFENRSRFFLELLHALKRALGAACGITTRFEIDTLHGSEGVEAHEDGVRMLELHTGRARLCSSPARSAAGTGRPLEGDGDTAPAQRMGPRHHVSANPADRNFKRPSGPRLPTTLLRVTALCSVQA
jgi:2,4-dienoyl-CoA reductase-like NADH-dependent reductase (Old Yellow Enzyme family)